MKKNAKKKVGGLIVLMILAAQLTACSGKKNHTDMAALEKQMLAADTKMPAMLTVTSQSDDTQNLFGYLSDIEYTKIQQYFFDYAQEGTAEEIAVIELKNTKDVQETKESLQKHISDRTEFYKTYKPNQAERAQNAVVVTKDRFVALIVSDNAGAIKNVFEETIK